MAPQSPRLQWRPLCPACATKMTVRKRTFSQRSDGDLGIHLHCRCAQCATELSTSVPIHPPARRAGRPRIAITAAGQTASPAGSPLP